MPEVTLPIWIYFLLWMVAWYVGSLFHEPMVNGTMNLLRKIGASWHRLVEKVRIP